MSPIYGYSPLGGTAKPCASAPYNVNVTGNCQKRDSTGLLAGVHGGTLGERGVNKHGPACKLRANDGLEVVF